MAAPSLIRRLKRTLGFTDEDARAVQSLGSDLRGLVPEVARRFYDDLFRDPAARAVFTGGPTQIARQQRSLCGWLDELLTGPYDDAYADHHLVIGTVHERVGLPPHYMSCGMDLLWRAIVTVAERAELPDRAIRLTSLHKLLMLDLSLMLESYRESFANQVRALEREAIHARHLHTEHLAEIGRLATTLAHEIKNPLAGISGAIQIIGDSLSAKHPHRPIIGEIIGQIRRLDATVRDLLQYSKPSPTRAQSFRIGETVERVLSVLGSEPALRKVPLHADVPATLPRVLADEDQIEQMLMNLVLNAADACTDGGEISIRCHANGQRVHLSIEDTGHGMTPEVAASAFDPFFTTKAKGTGLGLSICRRIVDAHHGTIALSSRVGQGTIVQVCLPADAGESE